MDTECENEKDEMMTEINNGDNLALSKKNTRDNAFEVNYLKLYFIIQCPTKIYPLQYLLK